MFVRQNVNNLGDDWAEPVLWYARGVQAMQAKPLADVTGWRFFAAIHGYLRFLWDFHGVTSPAGAEPAPSVMGTYFNQCQHQSWFFLPWHRGYLFALERQVRREIELLGGPHDTWALPYWNYFEANQNGIPAAFRTPDWPDGAGNNPLFVAQRWGLLADGASPDFQSLVNLNPLGDREFSGPGNGGSTGFGGRPTGFNSGGGDNGGLESQPHNIMHTLIGGRHPTDFLPPPNQTIRVPGLMSIPQTAALDPIFWLHHCNIDRLWESWNSFPPGKPQINPNDWRNPSGANWQDGPAATGDRPFVMPDVDGSEWGFTPGEMVDLAALEYVYEDLEPGAAPAPVPLPERVARLGISPPIDISESVAMNADKTVELMASAGEAVALSGDARARRSLRIDAATAGRLSASLTEGAPGTGLPDRVFLNLENVKTRSDAVLFKVYVGLPDEQSPEERPDLLAGTVSLFGVGLASDPDGPHAGNGVTQVLEITDIVDALHLEGGFSDSQIDVDLVPVGEISEADAVEIGNISIYRQSE